MKPHILILLLAFLVSPLLAWAVCPGGDAENDYVVHSFGCKAGAGGSGCAFPASYKIYYDTIGTGCSLLVEVHTTDPLYSHIELVARGAFPHNSATGANNSVVACIQQVDPDANGRDSQGYNVSFHAHAIDEL